MNWNAIGAIAETLGAVGVIASLVYLAGQIRQNTRSVQGATYQGLIADQRQAQGHLAYDGETSEIIRRGLQDSSQLSEADAFRFNWFMGGIVNTAENAMYQFQNGMLSPDRWQIQVETLCFYLASPSVGTWWTTFAKTTLSPDFVRLVDEEIRRLGEEQPPSGEALQ
jgi:hypothetical protein